MGLETQRDDEEMRRRRSQYYEARDEAWLRPFWDCLPWLLSTMASSAEAWRKAFEMSEVDIGWREMDVLSWAGPATRFNLVTIPTGLIDLCTGLRPHGTPFEQVLDPCAGSGLLLSALLGNGIARKAHGATKSTRPEPAQSAWQPRGVQLECASSEVWLAAQQPPDLIVSILPFGESWDETPQGLKHIRRSENRMIVAIAGKLRPDGLAVLVIPAVFFSSREGERVRQKIQADGVAIIAAFYLPPGALGNSVVPAYAIILARAPNDRLFVGELSDRSDRNEVLVSNLLARQPGASPGLGHLLLPDQFSGFPQVIEALEETRLQKASRYPFVRLDALCRRIFTVADHDRMGLRHDNTIFVPEDPRFDSVTDLEKADKRSKRCFAVDLSPSRAIAQYVSGFLNTELGRKARARLGQGVSMRRLREESVGAVMVARPSLSEQQALLGVAARLSAVRSATESISDRLWCCNESPEVLVSKIDAIASAEGRSESLEEWIQQLPFPLASILRRHQRHRMDREKAFNILIHFFEAFALIWATVLLSALDKGEEIPSEATKDARAFLAENKLPLEKSTLGTWVALGGKLASHLRQRLREGESVEAEGAPDPMDYFATRDEAVVDRLLNRRVSALLQQVGPLRARGQAHGGVISNRVAAELHEHALTLVSDMRNAIGDTFTAFRLVRIGEARLGKAVHTYKCDVLMGSDPQFAIESILLEDLAEDDQLYFVAASQRALRLLPLVRMSAPQGGSNACYFYSKLQGPSARYVSYHQEADAEEFDTSPLELLKRWNLDP